jgi:signal transduction histidine kinase/ligand-binding sensor domain-containing protein
MANEVAEAQMNAARAVVAFGTICLLFWCPHIFALDPSVDVSQYAHTAWTYRDGFVQGAMNAITQTPDGYLWLATQSGVVRFDGVRTVPLPLPPGQQLPSTTIGVLLTARDGTLWIGTLDGLASWKNGQLTDYPALARHTVVALLQDRTGTIWAGGTGGATGIVCAIRDGSTNCYGDDGSFGTIVASLYEDSDGSLWVGAATGIWRWRPGPPTRYLATPISRGGKMAQGDHGLGVIVALATVRQIIGRTVTDYPLHGVPMPLTAATVLRDRNGGLWIGTTAHGLVHSYGGKTSIFTHKDGLSSDQVNGVFEGREGSIWVATSEGLDQFRDLPITSLSVKQGLSGAAANSVLAARDGSIWIGTTDGLYRWRDGRTSIYQKRTNPVLPDDDIESLFEDERDRIWVSSFSGLAVFENGKFTAVPSVPAGAKNAITGDNHGGLWLSLFGTGKNYGLAHLVDRKIIEQVQWHQLGGGPGTGLVPDPDGGVLTGLLSGGMAYVRAGQIRNLPLSDDPAGPRRVFDISRARDGSIWAATENGLARIQNGRVATLTTANGLPCKTVHWIIEDDQFSYWLYTQSGLLHVGRTDMEAWIADPKRTIHVTTFDADDGVRLVPILKGARPGVTKSADGKIWFVNGDTVSFFDPSRASLNTLPPPVHIEQITANGKAYDLTNGLRLPAGAHDVLFDFTALSLMVPRKVRFRVMLEGQDKSWRELVNQRQVHYTNLAPRAYRFRVLASNNSEVWNEQGDTLEFSIDPAYYQTYWFRALCTAAFMALSWAAYQYRVRRLHDDFQMTLEARVGERTRIARDLHDTLLQSFHGLLLRFQTVSVLLPGRPIEAKEKLDSAIEQAAGAITEGRDAVQGLRASTVERNDLALAISTLGEELENGSSNHRPATFRVAVEGQARDLHPILRDEIYKIAAEALRNAFHHAQATQVEVEIRYGHEFRLRVRDDGKGMDAAVLSSHGLEGHYGLRGMRERATLIQGKLVVWSEVDEGTEVELRVPASAAYTTDRKRSWLLQKFAGKTKA